MPKVLTQSHPFVTALVFPPGKSYDITSSIAPGRYVEIDGALNWKTTFEDQFGGGTYFSNGIVSLINPGVNIQAYSTPGRNRIFYTPTQLAGSWVIPWSSDPAHNFGLDFPRIFYDRTDHHVAWTMAINIALTEAEAEIALGGFTLDFFQHSTGNYLPWYVVNTTDGGATWAEAFLEYVGQLEGYLIAGTPIVGPFLNTPSQAFRVSDTSQWYDFQVVAPAHDGVNCYSFATINDPQGSGIPGDYSVTYGANHTWIILTDAAGNHSGNLVFEANADYGSATTSRIVLAETDPNDTDKVYCMSNDGGFYVLAWGAGTLTSHTVALGVTGTYGEDASAPHPGSYSLVVADDSSIIVPNIDVGGGSFIIRRSVDGGVNWATNDLSAQLPTYDGWQLFSDIHSDGTIIIQVGNKFFWSVDNGVSWLASSVFTAIAFGLNAIGNLSSHI